MNMENIIFIAIIAIAVIYIGRKVLMFIISKEPPSCPGCGHKCSGSSQCSEDSGKQD